MAGIGHNSGQVDEPGQSWRRFAWAKARADLMPTLPIEVVRLRVKRAQALGLPYKTYAGIRASTGHDLIGFLFSSNALCVFNNQQTIPESRQTRLAAIQADRVGVAQPRVSARSLSQCTVLDAAFAAPPAILSWSATRIHLRHALCARGAADRYVIVGETALERDWVAAAGAAGWIAGDDYFAATP